MSSASEQRSSQHWIFALVVLATVLVGFWVRRPLADDAFITFRYAAHFLEGKGLIYNAGEKILGLSTPLWGLILAGSKWAGISYQLAALIGGAAGFILTFGLIYFTIFLPSGAPGFAPLLFPMTFLSTMILGTVFSGMETGFYILSVFSALHFVTQSRWKSAGIAAGLATLFRPDGAVCFAVVGLFAVIRDFRKVFGAGGMYLLVVAPWLLYAWSFYGSPVPQSVAAKQVLHPSTPIMNLQVVGELFARTPSDFLLAVLGASGMIFLAMRGRCLPHVLWCGLYLAGIVFSGLKPIFYWYFAPVWFCFATLGTAGVGLWLTEKRAEEPEHRGIQRARLLYLPVVSAVVVISSLIEITGPDAAVERDNTYRQIGRDYVERIKPGEVVYVGETGLLGYSFLQAKILDSSGINSMAPYQARKKARERLSERGMRYANMSVHTSWGVELVKEQMPDWIIAPRGWCQMMIIEDEPWFQAAYDRLEIRFPEHLHGIGIYRLKPQQSGS